MLLKNIFLRESWFVNTTKERTKFKNNKISTWTHNINSGFYHIHYNHIKLKKKKKQEQKVKTTFSFYTELNFVLPNCWGLHDIEPNLIFSLEPDCQWFDLGEINLAFRVKVNVSQCQVIFTQHFFFLIMQREKANLESLWYSFGFS